MDGKGLHGTPKKSGFCTKNKLVDINLGKVTKNWDFPRYKPEKTFSEPDG